ISDVVQQQIVQSGIAPFLKDQHELTIEFLKHVILQWQVIQSEYQGKMQKWLQDKIDNAKQSNQPFASFEVEQDFDFKYSGELVIHNAWHERLDTWKQLNSVFGDLSQMLGRDVDITKGILKHQNWRHIERLQELLKCIDEFKKIVDALGRLQESINNDEELESFFESISRVVEEIQEKVVDYVPEEMSGIERSSSISRMLPQEALFLGHSKLKMLWHAKRYEQALLSYKVQGIEIEKTWGDITEQQEIKRPRPRFDRGPMLIVIDTSGSMSGTPEIIAKALTLQAAKNAHAEKRACYLYAFGGQGQRIEHDLKFTQDGIQKLLEFLGYSFGGGNDIETVEYAVKRLEEEQWKKADVMIVSDGEWTASSHIEQIVKSSAEKGTRFHGVQVGGNGQGLKQLCKNTYSFKNWDKIKK
ncbi:MAG: VWA domain-containing protein, partial [Eubacterium sp.]